ncbi:hypothetical protein [Salidesulfovibrio onnuriiensis]|uniref:hypothetical protein n=1 Tax=Salidesulfovibrio onnuriiensis TaxID=2583823 RepID=UPI0011CC3974|nr:hypothetical protein [Salidesulfovibrio onnuriiensis]
MLFSFLFIWAVSAFFLNSITPVVWDDVLQGYVRKPGTTVHWRSEGWADIPVGDMGLDAHDAVLLLSDRPCFVLWGDSHVDAVQVPSGDRAVARFNAGNPALKAVAVGGGGLNVADYYYRIPRLQGKFPNIRGNVILISGMEDVLPGRHVDCHSRFLTDPWRFEESLCEPSRLALDYAPLVYELRLGFLHAAYREIKDQDLRFACGPQTAEAGGPVGVSRSEEAPDKAWDFMLEELKAVGRGWLAFIYIPEATPRIGGNSVRDEDRDAHLMRRFQALCKRKGVGFIDLSADFVRLYRKKGLFPRGFSNSRPGAGHLNEHGHALVAEALGKLLEGKE